jgi:signal transduction histidine kinase
MEQRSTSTVNDLWRNALLNGALLLVYFAAGKFGLSFFGLIHPSASAVWLPTGIAIAAMLILGRRVWPAVFAGAFLVNLTTEGSVLTSLGVATGNTLEGVVAAELVRRFAGGRDVFGRAIDILKFAGLAAVLSTTISATIGVASLTLGGYAAPSDFAGIWFTWWLGDASGAMLVTPLIVAWSTDRARQPHMRATRDVALLYASVAATGGLTFFHPAVSSYPLAFLCLAPLVWGALRFGPREVATAVALLSAIALAATATGHGSFVLPTPNESLLVLQAFMGLIAMTALPMAALTVERGALLERERAARADADAASRAKDEFLAILSHELRNPLSAISAAAAVLEKRKSGNESQLWISVIERQTRHLGRLIDDLFDIGRLTANRMSLRKELLDLACTVGNRVRELETAGILGTGRIDLDLQTAWVHADRDRLEQVIDNLIGNSIRHTPPDGRIGVRVRARGNEAELGVEDDGAGIHPDLLPRVFDAFTQGEQGLDRNPGGLGIGLTLVRRLAVLHGGSVEAQSGGPGCGSAFIVRLPLEEPPAVMQPGGAAGSQAMYEGSQRSCRLLIVEDNEDARQGLRALLEFAGHEVHEAADGTAGVAAALELAPDAALIDIGLPLLDVTRSRGVSRLQIPAFV